MELSLKYNEHATHSLRGAFIRGNTPGSWLQEINAWQIPLEQLVCFIISQNNNPLEAAGLFVIFRPEQLPNLLRVRHPYTVMGGKLFVPIDAELSPAISEAELQFLLMWDYQVFHPTIGFVGFERSDRITLTDLLRYREPKPIDWGAAHAGQLPWIPLHQINVQQPSPEEVFESIKDAIGNKPLDEIPKTNKKDFPGWLNNPVTEGLLKGAFFLMSGLSSVIPAGVISGSSNNEGRYTVGKDNGTRGGWFSRVMNWMADKIGDLEKQRNSELERLTDLFEKNMDEALRYAIPLSSPYLNRGKAATRSSWLTRRSLQFNVGRLGGGQAVDGWNVDSYYDDLRSKYMKAAQQAIAQKDFKKAAYVYAHLLGDYFQAALTLRQGNHFREAAVLYKEHIKNLPLAAACLEEGGLHTEAIELYTELNQHEKAGDLYMLLNRKEPALQCYEKCVVAAAANKDYLEQSRILIDKIQDRSRAKKVLLNGWQDVKQPEACLMKYFDVVADENNGHLPLKMRSFYTENILVNKELSFLNVIDKVNRKYKSTELEITCRDIAYEVVSEQVTAGNAAGLHSLRNFVPDDQLINSDCYRFIHTFKHVREPKPAGNQLQLVKDVVWKKVLAWQNQLLVWGTRSSVLVLARLNSSSHAEYYSWNINLESEIFIPVADPDHTNRVLVYNEDVLFGEKILPKNKYFQDKLIVYVPDFLHANVTGIGMHNQRIFTLHPEHGEHFLNQYTLNGEAIASSRCMFNGSPYSIAYMDISEMIYCEGFLYVACDNLVVSISETGEAEPLYRAEGAIEKMAVSKRQDGLLTIAFASADSISFFTRDADDNVWDPFVVNDIITMDLIAMPGDRFALAEKQNVQVLDFFDYTSPTIHWEFETESDVIAVFPGSHRDQLGILDVNGLITWHTISESA
jgi:tetratricopeptide (TPR) repeat protein